MMSHRNDGYGADSLRTDGRGGHLSTRTVLDVTGEGEHGNTRGQMGEGHDGRGNDNLTQNATADSSIEIGRGKGPRKGSRGRRQGGTKPQVQTCKSAGPCALPWAETRGRDMAEQRGGRGLRETMSDEAWIIPGGREARLDAYGDEAGRYAGRSSTGGACACSARGLDVHGLASGGLRGERRAGRGQRAGETSGVAGRR